jgi:hypothetical protein
MRRVLVVALALVAASCGIARQRELQAQMASLRQQSGDAMKDCNERFPPGNPKIAIDRARCVNGAFEIALPTMPYPDLLQVFMANNLAIAEQVQTGHTSLAQGNAAIAEKWSALVGEEQRRRLANVSAAAQVEAATAATSAAAAGWQAAAPRTCSRLGPGTVTCY